MARFCMSALSLVLLAECESPNRINAFFCGSYETKGFVKQTGHLILEVQGILNIKS